MTLSVIDPISRSFDQTIKILFKPFSAKKWLFLGFCMWLARLGQGGGGFNVPGGGHGGSGHSLGSAATEAKAWVVAHLILVLFLIGLVSLFVIGIMLLLTWLSSRGRFMFLDGVVHNRGAVRAPWSEFKTQGNSLFLFLFLFGIATFLIIMGVFVFCGVAAWPDIVAERFGPGVIVAIIAILGVLVPFGLLCTLIGALVNDFVVPVMYLRRVRVLDAWRSVWEEIITPHPGATILFYLMRIVLLFVTGAIALCVTLLTCCCIAFVPFIGTVILLPLYVFMRCYSLYFIEQIGPEMKVFPNPRELDDLMPDPL